MVFLGVFLQIVLAPGVFLNVGPEVNIFVHGLAFYISFISTLAIQWYKRIYKYARGEQLTNQDFCMSDKI